MTGRVEQYIRILEQLAPVRLAESWDNVGLQIGSPSWTVKKVCTALDPSLEVVTWACDHGADLLVTHHPLFFAPIRNVDGESPLGRIIALALTRRLAIFCAHTNLDKVMGGVNDALAHRIGIEDLRVLGNGSDANLCKLVVFVPSDHVASMLSTVNALDVGRIGNYRCCTFRAEGIGTFLPEEKANPALGEKGLRNEVQESRLETIVPKDRLGPVIESLKTAHPYETMAYDVYPVIASDPRTGLGRIGKLKSPLSLVAFAKQIKSEFDLKRVKMVGNPNMVVETVAVCSGSGSSLMTAAVSSGAQVYVTGDLGYHTARDAQQEGIGLVDIGHFASEHLIAGVLAKKLKDAMESSALTAAVTAIDLETDPFRYI